MFFVGQYVLASMMAPSFASGSITGEKERKATKCCWPARCARGRFDLGKLVASLAHLAW